MNNPFVEGNREALSDARRNPVLGDDDLIPTTSEALSAEFDRAYFRTGSGIDNVINDLEIKRNKQISTRMKQDGFSSEDVNTFSQFYRPALKRPDFDFTKDMDPRVANAKFLYDQIKGKYPDIQTDEQIRAEAKAFSMGEVKHADKIADKSDSLTLALLGGFSGVFTDPSVIGTMFVPLGQEVAIAKTGSIVSNILKRSAVEGGLGATGEALSIPLQQRNHAFLEEDFTTWDAAANIAMAGGGGFLLSALGRSGLETYKYIREIKRGTRDAKNIITNNIDPTPDQQAAVNYMEDVSYTANRAVEGDEFPPLYGEKITDAQYVQHMDDAKAAYEEAMNWDKIGKGDIVSEVRGSRGADFEIKQKEVESLAFENSKSFYERTIRTSDEDKHLFDIIRESGGINRKEAISQGIDPSIVNELNRSLPGRPVFTKDGISLDGLAERLNELDSAGRFGGEADANRALQELSDVVNGNKSGLSPNIENLVNNPLYENFPPPKALAEEFKTSANGIIKALEAGKPTKNQQRIRDRVQELTAENTAKTKADNLKAFNKAVLDEANDKFDGIRRSDFEARLAAVEEEQLARVFGSKPKFNKDVEPSIDDEGFYKDILTESDRAFDEELLKQAAKVDIEMPVATRTGEEGEIIIDTRSSKSLAKELNNELNALEGISMCMRGAK